MLHVYLLSTGPHFLPSHLTQLVTLYNKLGVLKTYSILDPPWQERMNRESYENCVILE